MAPKAHRATLTGRVKLPMRLVNSLAAAAVYLVIAPLAFGGADAPQTVLLWPGVAPGSEGRTSRETVRRNEQGEHIVSNVHAPSITPYLPARGRTVRTAVVVIPGGGHAELWMDHEGNNVAAFLAGHGVAAFVLKYRLARAPGSTYTVEGDELADVQRAIRVVRSRAAQWRVDPARVGVMGFSAGGELVILAATANAAGGAPQSEDAVERMSARPSFQALLYPAIPQDVKLRSDTPTAFLACGAEDQPAVSLGLPEFYLAMRRAGAQAELHVYAGAGHGFGLRAGNSNSVAAWPGQFLAWLDGQGFKR
jgi:acetyl esterase/lipase